VVPPEFVPPSLRHAILQDQTAWLPKTALHFGRRELGVGRILIDVPDYLVRQTPLPPAPGPAATRMDRRRFSEDRQGRRKSSIQLPSRHEAMIRTSPLRI